MLDSDLADLYGVETRYLNKAVQRNIKRLPPDFLFTLTREEYNERLKAQFGNLEKSYGGRRKMLNVFSENGVAMLSGVLQSDRAIEVNISIMRTFTKLRQLLASDESLAERVQSLEKGADKLFKIVFERLDGPFDFIYRPGKSSHKV